MNKDEYELFCGIFMRLGYFEVSELDYSPEEVRDILESYRARPLAEALEKISKKIVRHTEDLPEYCVRSVGRKIS